MIPVALGLLAGVGVLLMASPWLWPRHPESEEVGPVARPGVMARVATRLAQAGMARVAPGAFLTLCASLGVAVGAVVGVLLPIPALAVVAGVAAAILPWMVVGARARRRRRLVRAAWPDLVDHLVAGLRSGESLGEAVGSLAEIGPAEIRPAFAGFERELRARGLLAPALDRLKEELADPVADRLVETIRLAREVGGGELPTVLRALASSLRLEGAARAEAEARQSWVVAAARLGVVAPWVVLLVLASRPEAAAAYASAAGAILLLVGGALTVVAYRLMLAVGRLPEERRWFA
ncbi:MAG: type II secretion system F family protein [Actinomycetales bacterium]|nr:type II secretion system F family protein [Actinomycetales bacterium]